MGSLFWLAIAIFALIVELTTFLLVSIWFSIAALVVSVLTLYLNNIYLEFFIFAVLSLILLIVIKKLVKKYTRNSGFDSSFAGTSVKVLKKDGDFYDVNFKGVIYKAISKKEIVVGDYYKIKRFIGNKIELED